MNKDIQRPLRSNIVLESLLHRGGFAKLPVPGSFEELDLRYRLYEMGFEIGNDAIRWDRVVDGYGLVNERPVTIWANDSVRLLNIANEALRIQTRVRVERQGITHKGCYGY